MVLMMARRTLLSVPTLRIRGVFQNVFPLTLCPTFSIATSSPSGTEGLFPERFFVPGSEKFVPDSDLLFLTRKSTQEGLFLERFFRFRFGKFRS